MKKNGKGLRMVHALEVSNNVLETLEKSLENVTEVQEMLLVLLAEIMFNTATLVDMDFDKLIERGTHDDKRHKCNDC